MFRWLQSRSLNEPTDFPTLDFDGIQWKWDSNGKVVAIGDVHGDLRTLGAILQDRKVVDEQGNWIGGQTTLVLLGDLIGGKEASRLVLEFLLRLEAEAPKTGGKVLTLIGNHDLLVFAHKTPKATHAEKEVYRSYSLAGLEQPSWKLAFAATTPYGQWLARRNAIVQIGETIFCHAGLGKWAPEVDFGRVNATVRAWIRYWQGMGSQPEEETRWTVGTPGMDRYSSDAVGPIWTRGFKISQETGKPKGGPKKSELEKALQTHGAKRIVVGHAPTPHKEAFLEHPHYGPLVVMIDTALSDHKRGNPCALEIVHGTLAIYYAPTPDAPTPIEEREWKTLRGQAFPENPIHHWWRSWRN